MYRRILVAIDGSDTAQLALDHALNLAREQQARVRIVHALESVHFLVSMAGGYPFDASALIESMRADGERVLEQARVVAHKAGVDAETALIEGETPVDRAATIIVQDALRWDADLIVVGTHGRRGFDRIVLGSVAETLVRIAHTPVLLVRAR
jgi:nucleotide-binding universal stress UspA family protein